MIPAFHARRGGIAPAPRRCPARYCLFGIQQSSYGSRHFAPSRAMNSSATVGPQVPAG